MVVEIINIKKCLVISAEITNVVVANGRNYTTTQDILVSSSKQFGRSLVALLPRVVVTVCQNKEAAPSFYTHTLTKFLTYKWQTVSKICSRRKVRRVQTYSLRNRLNLSLISQIERLQNLFAKFKTLCTFVSANVAISNKIRYILNRITMANVDKSGISVQGVDTAAQSAQQTESILNLSDREIAIRLQSLSLDDLEKLAPLLRVLFVALAQFKP